MIGSIPDQSAMICKKVTVKLVTVRGFWVNGIIVWNAGTLAS